MSDTKTLLINNSKFNFFSAMSKGQAKKSCESHNPQFTLSTVNVKMVVFPSPSTDTNAASSGKLLFISANI